MYDTARASDRGLYLGLLIGLSVLLLIQLFLGASPVVVLFCAGGLVASFVPLALFGRDLYTLFAALVGVRYLGLALILKTLAWQSLDSNLHYPAEAFALTAVLMAAMAAILLLARRLDRGRPGIVPRFNDLTQLRRLSVAAFLIGITASVVSGLALLGGGQGHGGIVLVLATQLANLVYLGLIAEARHRIHVTQARTFISGRLLAMLSLLAIAALFVNVRGYLVNGIVALAATAFLFHAIRASHVVLGAIGLALVVAIVSPVILAVRDARHSLNAQEFAQRSADLSIAAITNPDLRRELAERNQLKERYSGGLVAYDYFGDRSNVPNRLSFVALVDAVYNGTQTHTLVGWSTFQESLIRVVPRVLYPAKPAGIYQHGDWLSWRMGMSERGRAYAAVFCLPMEGLASFGIIGFLLLPSLVLLALFRAVNLLTSLRYPYVGGLMIFAAMQHYWVEGTSDAYLGMIFRDLPTYAVLLIGLNYLVGVKASRGLTPSRSDVRPGVRAPTNWAR